MAGLVYVLYKAFVYKEVAPVPPAQLLIDLEDFTYQVNDISKTVSLLESFTKDYFLTLTKSGFKEVYDISETLTTIDTLCHKLLAEYQFDETQEILNYVLHKKGVGEFPQSLSKHLLRAEPFLSSWLERLHTRIELIDQTLTNASQEFESIGRVRQSTRNSTSTILGEIRQVLLEERKKRKKD